MKRALVLQHVLFEDLGTLEPALRSAGFEIEVLQAGVSDLARAGQAPPDLLVVLGGPIGVYEQQEYPFLKDELQIIRDRLAAERPTLGICLGAQLMAAALGARVAPGTNGKEIGWSPLRPVSGGAGTANPLASMLKDQVQVLHWHGDTFDIPAGAVHLAGTAQYPNQAFSVGTFALALQFHPEVAADPLERWYIGHAVELAHARVSVPELREAGLRNAPVLGAYAGRLWNEWLGAAGLAVLLD